MKTEIEENIHDLITELIIKVKNNKDNMATPMVYSTSILYTIKEALEEQAEDILKELNKYKCGKHKKLKKILKGEAKEWHTPK